MIDYENLALLNRPFFAEYTQSFQKVMEGGWYILGKEVQEFEQAFATYCQSRSCVGVASGLDALMIGLKSLDLPQGSEVLVPSNTYIATILAILQLNLVPVLVEPRIETYNINPDEIRKKITKKTKAIMVVHLYGKMCEMRDILSIANEYGLSVLEDCAQSHGAMLGEKKSGTFGDIGAFSFYPTKNLGALGDGGAITVQSTELEKKIRILRNYGSEKKYYNEVIGFNSRLDEIQAGFLSIKLKSLDQINDHKNRLAKIYHETIESRFIKPKIQAGYYDVYHIYNIRHPKRDELRQYLLEKGIKTEIHYPVAPHLQVAMKDFFHNENYSISEEIHRTTLSLPISYFHTEADVRFVAEAINSFK